MARPRTNERQLSLALLTSIAAMTTKVNVGWVALTVSSPAGSDWPLSPHSCHSPALSQHPKQSGIDHPSSHFGLDRASLTILLRLAATAEINAGFQMTNFNR